MSKTTTKRSCKKQNKWFFKATKLEGSGNDRGSPILTSLLIKKTYLLLVSGKSSTSIDSHFKNEYTCIHQVYVWSLCPYFWLLTNEGQLLQDYKQIKCLRCRALHQQMDGCLDLGQMAASWTASPGYNMFSTLALLTIKLLVLSVSDFSL